MPLCTTECVSNMTIDNSKCMEKCSGMIVTSYVQKDMVNSDMTELIDYLSRNGAGLANMANYFKGIYISLLNYRFFFIQNFRVKEKF